MKKDIFITTWNCQECSEIKSQLDNSFIMDDDKLGKDNQHLIMIQSFSNVGARFSLDSIIKDCSSEQLYTPVVVTNKDQILKEPEEIIHYFKEQGFIK